MNILVIGSGSDAEECKRKFGTSHQYHHVQSHQHATPQISDVDVVFDFVIDKPVSQLDCYQRESSIVFLNTVYQSLLELKKGWSSDTVTFYGFNGMPTFLQHTLLEVVADHDDADSGIRQICTALGTDYAIVDDRVGMVTPRAICMIINEAYFTVQEKTATREDVDLAMKLGTNYPYGPFEWCERIGVAHVYRLLDAVYLDTKDERYKICPLLKKEYLRHS